MRHFSVGSILFLLSILVGCGSQPTANTNAGSNSVNANAATNANSNAVVYRPDNANLPPDVSGESVEVPANSAPVEQRAQDLKKNRKPGEPLAPGIPDEETMRRQMKSLDRKNTNSNVPAPPPGGGSMMRKRPVPSNANQ